MNIDNARELKLIAVGGLQAASAKPGKVAFAAKFVGPGHAFGIAAQPMSDVDKIARTMAVGLVKKSKGNYHLAVRLQRRSMADSPALENLRRRAKREIDVRYVGQIVKRAPWYQNTCRPLLIGCSIGHFKITAGTLGCFVRDRTTDEVLILSNNHVLANENGAHAGDAVLQPGAFDGGLKPGDVVGKLKRFVKLKVNGVNLVDAALATISSSIEFNPTMMKGIGKRGGLGSTMLDEGTVVAKLGRTTGVTHGRVTAFEVDNVVVGFDIGNLSFDNQIEIEGAGNASFSDGGDSGSLIVDEDKQGVGLLFAGGDQGGSNGVGLTYANPLATVLDLLKVDLA